MRPLAPDEILDLDAYEDARAAYREAVIELTLQPDQAFQVHAWRRGALP